jgi:hypothetical protein
MLLYPETPTKILITTITINDINLTVPLVFPTLLSCTESLLYVVRKNTQKMTNKNIYNIVPRYNITATAIFTTGQNLMAIIEVLAPVKAVNSAIINSMIAEIL